MKVSWDHYSQLNGKRTFHGSKPPTSHWIQKYPVAIKKNRPIRTIIFGTQQTSYLHSQIEEFSDDSPFFTPMLQMILEVDLGWYHQKNTQIMSRILIVKFSYGDHIHWSQDSKPGDFFCSFYVCPEQTCFKKRAGSFTKTGIQPL